MTNGVVGSSRLEPPIDKVNAGEFSCPSWFSPGAKALICRILDPNPQTRIRIQGIKKESWFRKNYDPVRHAEDEEVNLDDVRAVFDEIEDLYVSEQLGENDQGPLIMNAFEMITLSQGLNLSALFDRQQVELYTFQFIYAPGSKFAFTSAYCFVKA
ncbi:hypothetical protein GIB67_017810 [Kingdonia uniflora]|uniref:non-specific serine/threonine protein kinase n=1 Tax=Kingdonia uniflora TaxID=39325 RepID=A0A7J7MPB1_9MAGN|nr:hypothetical protein GIB67_017810 [Kingdonia uniflora]